MTPERTETTVANPHFGPKRKLEVPCACVTNCEVVVVSEWDREEDDPHCTYIEFYTASRTDHWRSRIRTAWQSLRGKSPYYHCIILEVEQMKAMARFLGEIEGA